MFQLVGLMRLIRPLPINKTPSGNPVSMGLFECPECGKEVELRRQQGLKLKKCPDCKSKSTKYAWTIEDAKKRGILRAVRLLGNYKGDTYYLVQCPECGIYTYMKAKWLQQRTSCHHQAANTGNLYWVQPREETATKRLYCGYCKETIWKGSRYLWAKLGPGYLMACWDCEDEIRHEYDEELAKHQSFDGVLDGMKEEQALRDHFGLPPFPEPLSESS